MFRHLIEATTIALVVIGEITCIAAFITFIMLVSP